MGLPVALAEHGWTVMGLAASMWEISHACWIWGAGNGCLIKAMCFELFGIKPNCLHANAWTGEGRDKEPDSVLFDIENASLRADSDIRSDVEASSVQSATVWGFLTTPPCKTDRSLHRSKIQEKCREVSDHITSNPSKKGWSMGMGTAEAVLPLCEHSQRKCFWRIASPWHAFGDRDLSVVFLQITIRRNWWRKSLQELSFSVPSFLQNRPLAWKGLLCTSRWLKWFLIYNTHRSNRWHKHV